MTEYLLLFRNASGEGSYLTTTQDMARDMPKWESWIGGIAVQGKLVHTAPVKYDASRIIDNAVSSGPHKDKDGVLISGFLICKSDSIEEIEEWSKACPILQYPNSSVEIRPMIPFPNN